MKEKRPVYYPERVETQIRVGILTIVALIILIFGYGWLRDWFANGKYTPLTVRFDNANNIDIGDAVTIYGVKKGRVSDIQLARNGVDLKLLVQLDFPLSEDTQFYLRESSVMGSKQVDIIPGSSEELLDLKSLLTGVNSASISSLIPKIDTTMQKLEEILASFSPEEGLLYDLQTAAKTTNEILTKVDSVIDDSQENVKELITNLHYISVELGDFLANNRSELDEGLLSTTQSIEKFKKLLEKAETTLDGIKPLIDKINREEGTVQLLLSDRELYEGLLNTTSRIDSLLIDIKKNPRRYFQLKIF
ncbi:MAG: MlaD family protein [Candidatus Cloacimonadia bacterium]